MNHGLLTYPEAAKALLPLKVSVRSLKRFASGATPFRKRLKVVRLGHRTVGIKPIQLEDWKERCSS